ncbi:MAG: hypothetical protein FJX51_11395, partial [Alphaproteobacteria bacterium]|nr:hypothetical protein [Alphaproteobacteria bacterium]
MRGEGTMAPRALGFIMGSFALVAAAPALAHPGGAADGMAAGFLHPLGGLDHLLVILALGVWSAQLGGRALHAVPAAFVTAMALGGALGLAGVALPLVEPAILVSVVLAGALLGLATRLHVGAAAALAAAAGIVHGCAHGIEAPSAAPLLFASGFLLATTLLLAAGAGLGLIAR